MRIIITIVVSLLTTLTTFAEDSEVTPLNTPGYLQYVAQADSLAKVEKWHDAETMLRQALRTEPANPANQLLLANMGMILTAQGKYGDAIEHLNVALTLNPSSFLAHKHRGIAYSAMHQPQEAIDDFSAALEIDSTDNNVRCLRATLYAYTNRTAEAFQEYTYILDKDRNNSEALEGIANCCIAKGSPDEAVPFLNRLIEQEQEPEYYFNRGLIFARLGRMTEATADASAGLLLDPTNGDLWLLRAYVEKLTFRINEAKDSLAKARQYGADHSLEAELLPDLQ